MGLPTTKPSLSETTLTSQQNNGGVEKDQSLIKAAGVRNSVTEESIAGDESGLATSSGPSVLTPERIWANTQAKLDLPKASKNPYSAMAAYYLRVSSSTMILAGATRLMCLANCITANLFYRAVLETCDLEVPKSLLEDTDDQGTKTGAAAKDAKLYSVQLNYARTADQPDIKLELRVGNVEDYKVFMTLVADTLPDYVRTDAKPVSVDTQKEIV